MPHSLVIGITQSGKSTLAKLMAERWLRAGHEVGVLDPLGDEWPASWATTDAEYFLHLAKRRTRCFLIVDESGVSVGLHNGPMQWLTTTGRHLGHACYFLAQRAVQLPLTLRENCVNLFAFALGPKDARLLAETWNKPELEENSSLGMGEFKWVRRFAETRCGAIDFKTRQLRWLPDGRKYFRDAAENSAVPAAVAARARARGRVAGGGGGRDERRLRRAG